MDIKRFVKNMRESLVEFGVSKIEMALWNSEECLYLLGGDPNFNSVEKNFEKSSAIKKMKPLVLTPLKVKLNNKRSNSQKKI